MAAIIIWKIWSYHNKLLIEGGAADKGLMSRFIEANIKEHNETESSISNLGILSAKNLASHNRWTPPPCCVIEA